MCWWDMDPCSSVVSDEEAAAMRDLLCLSRSKCRKPKSGICTNVMEAKGHFSFVLI